MGKAPFAIALKLLDGTYILNVVRLSAWCLASCFGDYKVECGRNQVSETFEILNSYAAARVLHTLCDKTRHGPQAFKASVVSHGKLKTSFDHEHLLNSTLVHRLTEC